MFLPRNQFGGEKTTCELHGQKIKASGQCYPEPIPDHPIAYCVPCRIAWQRRQDRPGKRIKNIIWQAGLYNVYLIYIHQELRAMMTRTDIYLTEDQMKKFKTIAKKAGYPVAEIIRRAMDKWLEKYEEKQRK